MATYTKLSSQRKLQTQPFSSLPPRTRYAIKVQGNEKLAFKLMTTEAVISKSGTYLISLREESFNLRLRTRNLRSRNLGDGNARTRRHQRRAAMRAQGK